MQSTYIKPSTTEVKNIIRYSLQQVLITLQVRFLTDMAAEKKKSEPYMYRYKYRLEEKLLLLAVASHSQSICFYIKQTKYDPIQ